MFYYYGDKGTKSFLNYSAIKGKISIPAREMTVGSQGKQHRGTVIPVSWGDDPVCCDIGITCRYKKNTTAATTNKL